MSARRDDRQAAPDEPITPNRRDGWRVLEPTLAQALDGLERPHVLAVVNRGIGDLVMDTVVLQGVRDAVPHAEITALVRGPLEQQVIDGAAFVDRFMHFDTDRERSLAKVVAKVREWRRGRFDACVVSTGHSRHKIPLVALASGARHRVGEAASPAARLYTARAPFRPYKHKVESNWDILLALGYAGRPMPSVPSRSDDLAAADARLNQVGIGAEPFVVLHPGTSEIERHKRWPAERFVEVGRRLVAETSLWLTVTGGQGEEAALSRHICDEVGPRAIALGGALTVGELMGLLARARLFIGNDCGPAHLAAALGAPTLTVFGPVAPERTRPYAPAGRHVASRLLCSPCYPRLRRGCGKPLCVWDVTADQVLAVAHDMLAARA